MHGSPFITIIIPTYNSANVISRCIDSLNSQSFSNYEVIVMDGLSSDNTPEMLRTWSSCNPRVAVSSQLDSGVYDAMNNGIAKAKGEWLFFLGSDDQLFDDDTLKKASSELELSSCDMVYGNVRISGDTAWARDGEIYDGEFSVTKLFARNICHQSIFYRKSAIARIGKFNTDYRISADWDLNHRFFASGAVKYINQIISVFYGGGESSKYNNDIFTSQDIVLNLKKYHKIGYFDRRFKPNSWVFFNLSVQYLVGSKFERSVYFLFFAIFHSNRKTTLFKNYLMNIKSRYLTKHRVL